MDAAKLREITAELNRCKTLGDAHSLMAFRLAEAVVAENPNCPPAVAWQVAVETSAKHLLNHPKFGPRYRAELEADFGPTA
ncbi:hypothetical protein ACH427_32220 [Streptomyces sp. NPDC020379]|uniref:hypothetical protein n=1 Tax=Streptomyces sp. NPDC020379 TaxID=3365071 RepID=UPI003787ECDD